MITLSTVKYLIITRENYLYKLFVNTIGLINNT